MAECDLCGFPVGSDACNKKHNLTVIEDRWIPPPTLPDPAPVIGTVYRHVKRGTLYNFLMFAEDEGKRGHTLVVYRGVDDGKVWVRPASQFFDGRFEKA